MANAMSQDYPTSSVPINALRAKAIREGVTIADSVPEPPHRHVIWTEYSGRPVMIDKGRQLWAIGDVNGCTEEFERMLQSVEWEPHGAVDVICVGNMINLGPDSIGMLKLLMNYQDTIFCIRGNHEDAAIYHHNQFTTILHYEIPKEFEWILEMTNPQINW